MNNAADLTWTPCKNGKLQKKQPRLGVQSHDSYDICSASMQSRTLCHIYRYGPCTDSTCQTAKKQPPLMEYNKYMLGQLDKMTRFKWNKNSLFAGLLCFRPLLPRLECQNCQKKPVTHYFTINWLLLLLLFTQKGWHCLRQRTQLPQPTAQKLGHYAVYYYHMI